MREALTKLATQGYGQPPPPHEYEEMNRAKWIQTAKDIPVVLAGTALGYGLGRTGAEYLAPRIFTTPESQQRLIQAMPLVSAGASTLGSYLAMMQYRMLQQRREQAAKLEAAKQEAGGTSTAESELPQQTPVNAPAPKMAAAPEPAVGPRRTDPWRTDRLFKPYYGAG